MGATTTTTQTTTDRERRDDHRVDRPTRRPGRQPTTTRATSPTTPRRSRRASPDGEHFFWITSRAAGIVALLASSAAVALGLLMSTRLRNAPGPAGLARGALARDDRRAGRARARAARRRLPQARAWPTSRSRSSAPTSAVDGARDRRRLDVHDPRPLSTTRAPGSARSAGASCTASPRWPGCSASPTRSAGGTDAGAPWFLRRRRHAVAARRARCCARA